MRGDSAERYSCTAFGKPSTYDASGTYTGKASSFGNPYMFTGRRYDSESGLYYYRARMYSAELGRFLQTDPIGYYDSMNLYQYCFNSPINFVDSTGEASLKARPLNGRMGRFLANKLYGKGNRRGKHFQFHYDDGTDSGYFKHDKGTSPKFGPDSANTPSYDDTITDGLDDKLLREAEKKVQERWKKEGRQYNHPYNDCQTYAIDVLYEYYKLKAEQAKNGDKTESGD